jgi:hypothetical protein
MIDRHTRVTAALALWGFCALCASAADIANPIATPIKDPECLGNPAALFFSENVPPPGPVHPVLPIGHYYQIVRYIGTHSVSTPTSFDFGRIPQSYPYPPFRELPLTGLTVPEPKYEYQRTNRTDADTDNSSAFQLSCFDSGSYINTWTFPHVNMAGGGAHSVYGYSFDEAHLPAIYDANPGTDFSLQTSAEIPWFYSVTDPEAPAGIVPIGQVVVFAYLRDRRSHKDFALLLAIFDSQTAATGATYQPFVAHDTATPFVSTPIAAGSKYATLSPYSATFTGKTWSGLRFFRMHITQDNFRNILADINAFCAANPSLNYCSSPSPGAPAFSTSVTDYAMTDFGVLHEVFTQTANGNLSMGVHVFGLGAFNFR